MSRPGGRRADRASGPPSAADIDALAGVRVVLLSHVHDPATTPVFPGDPEFALTTAATVEKDGYFLHGIHCGEHTGTHWGAPRHFDPEGAAADDLGPEDLFLPAVRIDVREAAANDPDYRVTVADLTRFEREHGPVPTGAAVLLWSGWSDRWGTPAYANLDHAGVVHQPGFGVEVARWLVGSGRLGWRGALGSDTFGPDAGVDRGFAVSRLLYGSHRISLENLTNLAALPPTGARILVGGLMIRGGSGSPGIVYGVLPPSADQARSMGRAGSAGSI